MNYDKQPISLYNEILTQKKNTLQQANKVSKQLSIARLALFSALVICLYLWLKNKNTIWLITGLTSLVAFVALAVWHSKTNKKINYLNRYIKTVQNEIDCINLSPNTFDNGNNFKNLLPFADDLDLFGKNSLFHLINRCSTTNGKEKLAQNLVTTNFDIKNIIEKQEAVKELTQLTELRLDSITKLMNEKSTQHNSITEIKTDKILAPLRWIYPALMLASITFSVITTNFTPVVISALFAWVIAYRYSKTTELCAIETETLERQLSIFKNVLSESGTFSTPILKDIKQTQDESVTETTKLSALQMGFERRENLLWITISNILFLNDLHLIRRYTNWQKRNSANITKWIDNLAEYETLLSYSSFAYNNPEYTYPRFSDEMNIKGKNLRHPLLHNDCAVGNDVSIGPNPRFMLITGSNMSGKSTWLRTLGTNVIMAQTGMPVCANELIIKPMRVLSSLRQSDSLAESTSLFMNELNELRHILNESNKGNCLILLDEILRGTNSDDKYTGSLSFAKKISALNCITVMATHDLKLGELEHDRPDIFVNFCFESIITNDKLTFDYRIRRGIATNRNATWIMRDLGII